MGGVAKNKTICIIVVKISGVPGVELHQLYRETREDENQTYHRGNWCYTAAQYIVSDHQNSEKIKVLSDTTQYEIVPTAV